MDNLSLTKELDRFYYLWRESIAIYEDWAKQQGYLTMLLWLWKVFIATGKTVPQAV